MYQLWPLLGNNGRIKFYYFSMFTQLFQYFYVSFNNTPRKLNRRSGESVVIIAGKKTVQVYILRWFRFVLEARPVRCKWHATADVQPKFERPLIWKGSGRLFLVPAINHQLRRWQRSAGTRVFCCFVATVPQIVMTQFSTVIRSVKCQKISENVREVYT